jgi:hypothetical protein
LLAGPLTTGVRDRAHSLLCCAIEPCWTRLVDKVSSVIQGALLVFEASCSVSDQALLHDLPKN